MTDLAAREERIRWFREARFGMFIHWGLYAIPARGEWVRQQEEIPEADYEPLIHEFNPVDYRLAEWAKLCRQAGMICSGQVKSPEISEGSSVSREP